MESISKILDAISAQSLAETDKIMESSRQEAEELQKLYEKEALKARDNILSKANAEADGIRQRNLSQAGIESRNLLLSARRETIEKVFAKAAERLASMPDTEKKALYEKLISRYSSRTPESSSKESTVVGSTSLTMKLALMRFREKHNEKSTTIRIAIGTLPRSWWRIQ